MTTPTDTCELFGGKVLLEQYRDGYRFSIDSVLLSWWTEVAARGPVADLGAGCGVIAAIMAAARGIFPITAFELQPELAALCARNVARNGLERAINVVEADLRALPNIYAGGFACAVANPPFREVGSGRTSVGLQKAAARHELHLNIKQLLAAARFLLRPEGRLSMIYPARRYDELLAALTGGGFYLRRVRPVSSFAGSPPILYLLEASPAEKAAQPEVESPLVLYNVAALSPEVAAMYHPPGSNK
jgi:tRNA1Val (adenine37-N6)-methyltransferase